MRASKLFEAMLVYTLLCSTAMAATEGRAEQKPRDEAPSTSSSEGQPPPVKHAPVSPSTFTPSERIRADSSVSFPVDI